MRQVDQNRLSMWTAVFRHLDVHGGIWKSNKAFVRACAALTLAIESARDAAERQASNSLGASGDRDALRVAAVQRTQTIANCAKVYATEIGSNELLSALNYSKSALMGFPHNALAAQLRSMIRAAQTASKDLVDFGVPEDAYEAALETIRLMDEAQSGVRTAITLKKAVTISLQTIMESGQTALTKMDRLIHLFEGSDQEFVLGYKAVRSVVHVGLRHKSPSPDL